MRDILAYTESYSRWSPSLAYAARLAGCFDATLTGVFVSPSPLMLMQAYESPELLNDAIEGIRELEDSASDAGPSFISWARKHGATKAAWQVAEGVVPQALEHVANWHDVLVLGRTQDEPTGNVSALGHIALRVGIPCIIVPPTGIEKTEFNCVVLAWNGSAEAIRAIHAARPILKRASRVVVLVGEQKDFISELGWRPEFDLSVYLETHGIRFELQPLRVHDDRAGEALLAAASALDASMLVMGAYGRSRFSEWILGGATRHMLSHSTLPVFMRH
jgi:nucleotide-binding universal stress UspA family protein